jgi:hypothetical protein
MNRQHQVVLGTIWVSALLWTGCGQGPSAGGTIETENLSMVLSVDSLIPAGRRLGLDPVVATLRLDSLNFDFSKAASDGSDLAVESMDGVAIPFAIRHWNPADGWARIQVRFEGSLLAGGRQFRLRTGAITLSGSDSAAVWKAIPESLSRSWTSVLVDDFEQGDWKSLLPNKSPWYTNKSDSATQSIPVLVTDGGGRTGTAVRYDYNAPASTHEFVLLGDTLSSHPVNFRSLDSIVFWARGVGVQSVSLDHLWDGGGSKTWMHANLDTVWTRWRVRPQDFDAPGSTAGNLGWESVHDSVTNFSIFATGSGWVMLDDIRFYGMEVDDFK